MNVTFHTLASVATAAVLGAKQRAPDSPQLFTSFDWPLMAIGLAVGVLIHGLLDFVPHAYPIKSAVDVGLSLVVIFITLLIARRRQWLLLGMCFLGGIFPDLVDLGPPIINRRLGWALPTVKIFPWHWRENSGSVYDGSHRTESFLYHLIVVGVSVSLLYGYRRHLFGGRERVGEAPLTRDR